MPEFRDVTAARALLSAARADTDDGGFIDAGRVLDALDWADRGQPAVTPLGYVVARDLGDGRVEWWEARPDGTAALYPTADQARAEADRLGADPDMWRVVALVEVSDEQL